jgi:polyisoprenoid-binding protein YceI
MRIKTITVMLTLCAFVALLAAADTYEIDRSHSSVGFSVKHMVISSVKGSFTDFSGTIMYDEEEITNSSVSVTIKTGSINTGDDRRDGHLRSADFFDAENHPEITFVSKKVSKRADGHVVTGDLTMRGVTKEVEIPFIITGKITDPRGKTRIGVEGKLTIDRQDYGVSWSRTMDAGGLVVSDDVRIELLLEAVKQ